jgi:hypothetical protein
VSDHLVFSLEALAAFGSWADFDWTVVQLVARVNFRMAVEKVLLSVSEEIEGREQMPPTCVWKGRAVQPGYVH